MNKHLLFGMALVAATGSFSQVKKNVPTGIKENTPRIYPAEKAYTGTAITPNKPQAGPVKNKANVKTAATAATRFTGSMNLFSVLVSNAKPLQYNKDVKAVSFVHRKSATYVANPQTTNSASGVIVSMISQNEGTSWDSTCVYSNAATWARYPQGGIYNPPTNTNINNAYVVITGPATNGTNWTGNAYASKQLNVFDNNAGTDIQPKLNSAATSALNKHHFSRYSFTSTDDGVVRTIAELMANPDAGTFSGQDSRGVGLVKGVFSAGAFVWTLDSLIPSVLTNTSTNTGGPFKYLGGNGVMAWNEAGTVGYVVVLGVSTFTTAIEQKGLQPIVYKTTNSGASWSLLPQNNYMTPDFIRLQNRLFAISTDSNVGIPYFRTDEGFDAVVDVNDNLHIVTTVVGAYSSHNDSLLYTYVYGGQSYPFNAKIYPTIYDFHTTAAGTWKGIIVDSMGSEGPAGGTDATAGGYTVNPWTNSQDGSKMYLDARIQVGRSPNGKQIFYSWTETDTSQTGHYWNIFPDIKCRAWDVTTDKMTPRYNVTSGVTDADQTSYYHYMGNKGIPVNGGSGSLEIPFTITYNNSKDAFQPVEHYYINDFIIPHNDYTVSSFPLGVDKNADKAITVVNEVNLYPNPANNLATVSVSLKEAKTIDIIVYNALGQAVQAIKANGVKGNNTIDMDLTNLNAGVYIYNIKTGNDVVTKKLIKE